MLIHALATGHTLPASIQQSLEHIASHENDMSETSDAIAHAVALAANGDPSAENLESLGGGWVAEEALAIAVYCASAYPDPKQFAEALSTSMEPTPR